MGDGMGLSSALQYTDFFTRIMDECLVVQCCFLQISDLLKKQNLSKPSFAFSLETFQNP